MSFLVPLFLAGAALIIGPIVAHLIRRSTRDRIRFSDTQFLEPSPPRLQRRSRIENWWLLLLRCLIVLVLTLGFARPFFRHEIPQPPAHETPRHVVAVLDDSASMRREGRWPEAVARVRSAVDELGATDRFALLTGGGEVALLVSGEQWNRTPPSGRVDLVAAALEGHAPGWGPTRLDAAIDAALDELAVMSEAGEAIATMQILVVSDCTEGARLAGLAGRDWPPNCTVEIVPVQGPRAADVSLQWLGWTTTPQGQRAARVRLVEHAGRTATVQLHLRTADTTARAVAPAQNLPLAPNESRLVLVEVPPPLAEPLRLELTGDEEPFNNTLWLVPPQPREFPLPYWGGHDANDSRHARFYLTRAVSGWRDPKVTITPVENAAVVPPAPLLVVAGALDPDDVRRVRDQVQAGTFALVLLADETVIPTAAALLEETGWSAAPVPDGHALLGSIDFQHPLFSPFADPRYSDFSRVRFWKPVPVTLPEGSQATVVARFDDGSPAVLEGTVGNGRVVIWSGDWSNVASQWVLSTKFVPWLQALVERASGGPPRPNVAEVGDTSNLGLAAEARWHNPGAAAADAALAHVPRVPGIYAIEDAGHTRTVALQVPFAESRDTPLPADTWEQLGVPLANQPVTSVAAANEPAAARVAASDTATERDQQAWRWLLLGAVVLLALESYAAVRVARRTGATQPQTA